MLIHNQSMYGRFIEWKAQNLVLYYIFIIIQSDHLVVYGSEIWGYIPHKKQKHLDNFIFKETDCLALGKIHNISINFVNFHLKLIYKHQIWHVEGN